ncbi:putative gustatory receptor 36b [Bactrocera neohumeralis]|uniref:putative gustatory receptor 36b n=1 Tax=Bactrocera neohumeralis TaxID=98809 RepID=UPI0021659D6E|nr:putative gustatory receptor 36b [Bactrocera neohumeralis]
MYRITYWLLYGHYCYSLALGTLRFRYDFNSNKAHITPFITYYSAVMNVLALTTLPWTYYTAVCTFLKNERVSRLGLYVFIATKTLRLLAVALVIVYNWQRRRDILKFIRDINHLRCVYFARFPLPFEWQRRFEIKIIKNMLSGILFDALRLIIVLGVHKNQVNVTFIISNVLFSLISNILYLNMNHYYFAMRTIILFGNVLNRQLADIIKSAKSVTRLRDHQRCRKQFKARCLTLSRELDELALVHVQLQSLALRINDILKWQGVGVLLNVFILNISLIHTIYSVLWVGEFTISQYGWVSVLMGIAYLVYTVDMVDFFVTILEHVRVFHKSSIHLELHANLPQMNKEFERSVESFQLQLSTNEYQMSLLGLFNFNSECVFSMFASVVANSILIIQFDYQYFQ